jgi:hypothetical protein
VKPRLNHVVPVFAVILLVSCQLFAQSADAAHEKVGALVQQMTLEEKIDYIGGTGFAIRAVPRLNLPAFEMSDGPIGVRSNSGFPSTVYAAGMAWQRPGILTWPNESERESAKTPAPVAFISCWARA